MMSLRRPFALALPAAAVAAVACSAPPPPTRAGDSALAPAAAPVAARPTPRPTSRASSRPAAPAAAAFDTSVWPTTVIPITSETAPARTLWVGDRIALEAPAPPPGTPSTLAADLRWSSLEPAVARVSADGIVVAVAPGEAGIRAWRRVGDVVTPVRVLPAVRGRVAAADGGALRARIVVRAADRSDTVLTGADGAFAFRAPGPLREPIAVAFEALDAGSGYAPALLAGHPADQLADLRVVLLPTRWRLAVGSYAGESVPISPAIAQARAREGSRFWRVASGRADGAAGHPAVGWDPADLPLPVAFDRASGAIGPGDSVAFWRVARQLEADWGSPLFRPATLAPDDSPAAGRVLVAVDRRIGSAGLTTTTWNGAGDVSEAVVAVRSADLLGDAAIVTHELLHALGIGHAAGWNSVMHPTSDGGTGGRASAEDVAYGQLLYAVRARASRAGLPVGIAEAAAAAPGVP